VKEKNKVIFSILLVMTLILPALVGGASDFFIGQTYAKSSLIPVWVNNFNVNMDDWRIWGFNQSADPIVSTHGNFSIGDDTLRAYDEEWNVAQHNSTVAYGTWSFDIELVRTPRNHCLVAFASGWEDTPAPSQELSINPSYSYGMIFATGEYGSQNTSFVLFKRYAGNLGVSPIATYDPDDDPESAGWYEGWYEIDIIRNTRGEFDVYINGTLKMEATDTTFTTSEVFYIHAEAGIALDNVGVDNEPTIDYDSPEFVECEDQDYSEGESISYQMEAWDATGILGWLVNDTSNFQITTTGLLTNNTILPVGTYGLNITISDNGHPAWNYNSKVISITVLPVTTTQPTTSTDTSTSPPPNGVPSDLTIILIMGGGIAVVVIIAIIIKSRS
jgi:hypothetical protein